MPRQPPSRRTSSDTIAGPSVADQTTDRALTEIRELLARLQTKVAAINFSIDADLEFNDHSALEVHSMQMTELVSTPGLPNRIYMIGDDWFVSDGAGNEIQITTGGTLGLDAYGSRFKQIPALLVSTGSGSAPANVAGGEGVAASGGASTFFILGPEMRRGDRLLTATVLVRKVGATGSVTVTLYRRNAGGAVTSIGSTTQSVTIGTDADITVTPSSTETVAARYSYVLSVAMPQSNDRAVTVTFEHDRP